MRRRDLKWQKAKVNRTPDLDPPVVGSWSSSSTKSRRLRCRCGPPSSLVRSCTPTRRRCVALLLVLIVVIVATSSSALMECAATLLRRLLLGRRYTKENDPFYMALRFGNASAVAELYRGEEQRRLNHTTTTTTKNVPLLPVVFYNVYIPPPPSPIHDNAAVFAIVKEQLQQVQTMAVQHHDSITTTRSPRDDEVVVHLITISSDMAAAARAVDLCRGLSHLQCHHVRHAASGDETVGLQQLFEYCQVHPMATVTYLHAKGSYHPSPGNDAWRRTLTAAALHPDCWRHVVQEEYTDDDPVCQVCGLAFYTM
jgi:hypothetical protein